jgi:two-component system response regulator FixJ
MTVPVRIALVDDDEAVLDALGLYLATKGLEVVRFTSGVRLLEALDAGLAMDCVVTDVRMPDLDGVALYRSLKSHPVKIPVILITGHGDIDLAVTAVKEGVHDFIQKPFNEERLLGSILDVVASAGRASADFEIVHELANRVARLSERQREVMELAVQGLTNKEIADAMKITTRTVESYRAWVMERMGARNIAELIRIAMRVGIAK